MNYRKMIYIERESFIHPSPLAQACSPTPLFLSPGTTFTRLAHACSLSLSHTQTSKTFFFWLPFPSLY